MGAATLVSIEDYLSTCYSPDREYLDGRIVERNLGELTHGRIQRRLIVYFDLRSKEFGIEVIPEQRVHVSPTRFRVPDVTVVKSSQTIGEIFTAPPHLCIEILSKDDTLDYMQEKIDATCVSVFPTFGLSIRACAKATSPPKPAWWKLNPAC